jgi:protein phosphatase
MGKKNINFNLCHENGPFDIIGDVHGCFDELKLLLEKLGYGVEGYVVKSPEGRKAIFLGDYTDRGPKSIEVLKLVMSMAKDGNAICILGNHDEKLLRHLHGKNLKIGFDRAKVVEQLELEPKEFIDSLTSFLNGLSSYYFMDDYRLVVAHAGLKEEYIVKDDGSGRGFALYGETMGEMDDEGFPVRLLDWTLDYKGQSLVVYGHIAKEEVNAVNNTLGIDTGCAFGGRLTAYRYPEGEIVGVKALEVYSRLQKVD